MKKVLMAITVISLMGLSSCKKEETKIQDAVETTVDETTQGVEDAATDIKDTASELVNAVSGTPETPKFSTPEVQKFADEYSTYFNELMTAAKSGDAAKLQELTAKGTEWAKKAQEFTQKMSKEDAQKWTEWYSQLQTLASSK